MTPHSRTVTGACQDRPMAGDPLSNAPAHRHSSLTDPRSVGAPTAARVYIMEIHSHTTTGGPTMTTNYVMKVSSNGQVSIPAEARARWKAEQVVMVDLGDRVVVRPLPPEPVGG